MTLDGGSGILPSAHGKLVGDGGRPDEREDFEGEEDRLERLDVQELVFVGEADRTREVWSISEPSNQDDCAFVGDEGRRYGLSGIERCFPGDFIGDGGPATVGNGMRRSSTEAAVAVDLDERQFFRERPRRP